MPAVCARFEVDPEHLLRDPVAPSTTPLDGASVTVIEIETAPTLSLVLRPITGPDLVLSAGIAGLPADVIKTNDVLTLSYSPDSLPVVTGAERFFGESLTLARAGTPLLLERWTGILGGSALPTLGAGISVTDAGSIANCSGLETLLSPVCYWQVRQVRVDFEGQGAIIAPGTTTRVGRLLAYLGRYTTRDASHASSCDNASIGQVAGLILPVGGEGGAGGAGGDGIGGGAGSMSVR